MTDIEEIQRKWKYECYKFGDVGVDIVGQIDVTSDSVIWKGKGNV